jgi:hypothetical protein
MWLAAFTVCFIGLAGLVTYLLAVMMAVDPRVAEPGENPEQP